MSGSFEIFSSFTYVYMQQNKIGFLKYNMYASGI
jgi:hypothetical protein